MLPPGALIKLIFFLLAREFILGNVLKFAELTIDLYLLLLKESHLKSSFNELKIKFHYIA